MKQFATDGYCEWIGPDITYNGKRSEFLFFFFSACGVRSGSTSLDLRHMAMPRSMGLVRSFRISTQEGCIRPSPFDPDSNYGLDQHMKGWLKPRKTGTPYCVFHCVSISKFIHGNTIAGGNRHVDPYPMLIIYYQVIRNMKSAARQIFALFLSFFSFFPELF